jgi:hypothetical protein
MIELKDLGLSPKDYRKVKNWLNNFVAHFTNKAEGAKGTVERYDLENLDFFYFTDCRDVLNKHPESKGQEDNKKIIRRKRAVEYQLIFRRLLGEQLGKNRPCSHCGNGYRWINSLGDGTGHYIYCPKCAMTTVVTYPDGYNTCIDRIKQDITNNVKQIVNKNFKITGEKLHVKQEYEEQKPVYGTPVITTIEDRYESGTQNSLGEPIDEDMDKKPKLPKEPPLKTISGFLKKKKKRCTGDCQNCERHLC